MNAIRKDERNPKTGFRDGPLYTLGGGDCARTLNKIILETVPTKLNKVRQLLEDYRLGLAVIAATKSRLRQEMLTEWRNKYMQKASGLLSPVEGQSFLLNLIRTEHKKLIRGWNDRPQDRARD